MSANVESSITINEVSSNETASQHFMGPTCEAISGIISNSNHKLQKPLRKAIEVMENTLRLYNHSARSGDVEASSIFISFNGGKDATVVLFLLLYVLWKQNILTQLGTSIKVLYFEDAQQFPDIKTFFDNMMNQLQIEPVIYRGRFRDGIEHAISNYGMRAVLMGVRLGDPYTEEAEHFCPSTFDYPAFMRVYPILHWNYKDVWTFLRECQIPYCSLYDKGYTSIGNILNTSPNPALKSTSSCDSQATECYQPAHMLNDGDLERNCRDSNVPTETLA